jgi:hypothetical protein
MGNVKDLQEVNNNDNKKTSQQWKPQDWLHCELHQALKEEATRHSQIGPDHRRGGTVQGQIQGHVKKRKLQADSLNEYQMPQVLSKCEGGQIPLIALFKLTWLSTLKRDVGRDLLNYSAPASQTQLSYGILQRISQQWHPQSLFWHGRFEPPVVTESAEGLKTDGPVVLRSAPSPPFSQPSVLNFAEGRFQKVCSKYREILFLVKTLTWKFLAMTY